MGLDRSSSHLTFYLESLSQGSICSSQPALCPRTIELPASCRTKEKPILGTRYTQIELRDSPPLCITRKPSTYSHILVGDTKTAIQPSHSSSLTPTLLTNIQPLASHHDFLNLETYLSVHSSLPPPSTVTADPRDPVPKTFGSVLWTTREIANILAHTTENHRG